jgi:hypothetical protein
VLPEFGLLAVVGVLTLQVEQNYEQKDDHSYEWDEPHLFELMVLEQKGGFSLPFFFPKSGNLVRGLVAKNLSRKGQLPPPYLVEVSSVEQMTLLTILGKRCRGLSSLVGLRFLRNGICVVLERVSASSPWRLQAAHGSGWFEALHGTVMEVVNKFDKLSVVCRDVGKDVWNRDSGVSSCVGALLIRHETVVVENSWDFKDGKGCQRGGCFQ